LNLHYPCSPTSPKHEGFLSVKNCSLWCVVLCWSRSVTLREEIKHSVVETRAMGKRYMGLRECKW